MVHRERAERKSLPPCLDGGCNVTKTKFLLSFVALMLVTAAGFGCEDLGPPPDQGACGASCDDGNPCTTDACSAGTCVHEDVIPGEACLAESGFCDIHAVCRSECDEIPCVDWTVEVPYGCVYEVRKSGWTCTSEGGSGICRDGVCDTTPTTPG